MGPFLRGCSGHGPSMWPNLPGSLPIHLRSALPTATMEPKHAGNDTSVGGINPKRLLRLEEVVCTWNAGYRVVSAFEHSPAGKRAGASMHDHRDLFAITARRADRC